jgi:hypothetical protein
VRRSLSASARAARALRRARPHPRRLAAQPTGFEAETKRLAAAGVLVDTFFLGSRAADPNFEWIAAETKGACYALNICTPAGASELIDAVTPRCLSVRPSVRPSVSVSVLVSLLPSSARERGRTRHLLQ